jgi:hypothetical protein
MLGGDGVEASFTEPNAVMLLFFFVWQFHQHSCDEGARSKSQGFFSKPK